MNILILSDLHLEVKPFTPAASCTDVDVVVLAGGIHKPGAAAVKWARSQPSFQNAKAIVYVPGVLEHWSSFPGSALQEMRQAADGSHVHVLDCSDVVVQGVRFLGLTLWTDFQLPVQTNVGPMSNSQLAMDIERKMIADTFHTFSAKSLRHEDDINARAMPSPEQSVWLHRASIDWLSQKLAEPYLGKTVVVSHHAPHRDSIDSRFADDWTTPGRVNDLPEKFFDVPSLWIHGHSNCDFSYKVKNCIVTSNSRRPLPNRPWDLTNVHFDPCYTVSL